MLKAVIFDFDGVIADSELLHYKAFNIVLAKYDVGIPQSRYYSDYLGYTDLDCLKVVSTDFNVGLTDEQIHELIEEKAVCFDELAGRESSIIAGVADFISMLRQNGIRIGICSGALLSDIQVMLQGSGFEDAFEVVVTAEDVQKGKPDPEGFVLAVSLLNGSGGGQLLAGECVVVEDSHWGLDAARAAGIKTVGVTNTYSAEELDGQADMIVDSFAQVAIGDLTSLVDKL